MRTAPPATHGFIQTYAQSRIHVASCLLALVSAVGCSSMSSQSRCVDDPAECFDAGTIPVDMGGALGKECTRDSDCRSSLRLSCVAGSCGFASHLREDDPCRVTNECADGLFCEVAKQPASCQTAGSAAEDARCESTAECQRGLICGFSPAGGLTRHCLVSGSGDVGAPCAQTSECLAGLTCTLGDASEATCAVTIPGFELPSSWSGVTCGADESADLAYFRVPRESSSEDFFRLPFPNDVRRGPGGLDLSGFPTPGAPLGNGLDLVARYRDASRTLTGFSTNPVIYFRFSSGYAGVDERSVLLFDISKSSPDYGAALSRSWGTSSGAVTQYVCPNWLNVRSQEGSPLRPGTTYAALLTSQIMPRAGGSFARDADLDSLLASDPPLDGALQAAHAAYAPLRAFLADRQLTHGLTSAAILNAAVFTTHDPTALARAVVAGVRAAVPAELSEVGACGVGGGSPCALADAPPCAPAGAPYVELHGRMTLPIFQEGSAPYLIEGGGISLDSAGDAIQQRREQVCFSLSIPKGELPGAGLPLLIYGHGTGGSYRSALADFPSLAAQSAILSIDLPQHGSRKAGSTRGADELFFNYGNPDAALGNVLQGSADLLYLVRWAVAADLPADGPFGRAVRFDPTRIALFGHSQGATHASLLVPYATEVAGFVLSGVGGDVSEALVAKKLPVDTASVAPLLLGDREAAQSGSCPSCIGASHPAYGLVQGFLDRIDPVNFGKLAREGRPPPDVFMTFAPGDGYTPDATQSAYALSADYPLVAPELVSIGQQGALVTPVSLNVTAQQSKATQGVRQYMQSGAADPHFVYQSSAREDVERFLTNLLQGEAPVIGQ